MFYCEICGWCSKWDKKCDRKTKEAKFISEDKFAAMRPQKTGSRTYDRGGIKMNHMAEVAKMFGVELGEYFKVYDEEMNYPFDYYFSNHGLMVDKGASILEANGVLMELLLGRYKIRRHPCKPNNQESYWYVDKKGNIYADYWRDDDMFCINVYKLGNCYFSYENAKTDRDKWVDFYSSDNVLDI